MRSRWMLFEDDELQVIRAALRLGLTPSKIKDEAMELCEEVERELARRRLGKPGPGNSMDLLQF